MRLEGFRLNEDGTDWLPAMKRCLIESKLRRDEVIELPVGLLRFSGPVLMATGTVLRGSGGCPANVGQATVLHADFSSAPFLVWDGDEPYRGGGGGIESCVLAAANGQTPGQAILLTGRSPERRCGYWSARRVMVYSGADAGNFTVGLRVDGSLIKVSGSAGVRDIWVSECQFAGCSRRAVELINAVHFQGEFQTAQASGGSGDVLVDGGSEDVRIDGRIYGDLSLAVCSEVVVRGVASRIVRSVSAKRVSVSAVLT